MSESRFVRVYQPADQLEVAQVRMALEGARIPFFVQNEHFTAAYGLPYSMGAIQVFVMVPEDRADEAREALRDWFEGEPMEDAGEPGDPGDGGDANPS